MENAFNKDYENIIETLSFAKSEIDKVTNPEIQNLTTRLRLDLAKHINFLKVRIGAEPDAQKIYAKKPLTKIMGRVVATKEGIPIKTPKPILTTPRDLALAELKQKAEDIYSKFAITPSDQLFDTLSDDEVRAVAKKVGLPVTDKTPKRIDVSFIDQIKDAIVKKHESGALPVGDLNLEDQGDNETGAGTGIAVDEGNNKMLQELTGITNVAILEAYDENQIKDFAEMAGVEVTEDTKIDSKFVTQLKNAIKENSGTDSENESDKK